MKKQIVSSLAEPVGEIWKNLQKQYSQNRNFFVAAPLSSTPLPIFQWIIEHSPEYANWDKVKFVLMDEMLEEDQSSFQYISVDDPASYEGFAREHLLEELQINTNKAIEIIKPEISSIEEFDTAIDLLILAMGIKGNYANVMPGTSEKIGWHIAHLIPEFRQSHTQQGSMSYEGANFREYGMSLGPQQVISARNVVVIISGEKKRDLTKELFSYNSFIPVFPLSIIYHPQIRDRVIVFLTPDVLGNTKEI